MDEHGRIGGLSGVGRPERRRQTAQHSRACVVYGRCFFFFEWNVWRMQKYLSSAFSLELLSHALFGPRNGLLLFSYVLLISSCYTLSICSWSIQGIFPREKTIWPSCCPYYFPHSWKPYTLLPHLFNIVQITLHVSEVRWTIPYAISMSHLEHAQCRHIFKVVLDKKFSST
jgi:hypothetical protein